MNSPTECAESCKDDSTCLLWEFNKKKKNCKITKFKGLKIHINILMFFTYAKPLLKIRFIPANRIFNTAIYRFYDQLQKYIYYCKKNHLLYAKNLHQTILTNLHSLYPF